MRTRSRNKLKPPSWKKIVVSTVVLVLSPFIGSLLLRFIPDMVAAAERAAIVSAGLSLPEGGKLVIQNGATQAASSAAVQTQAQVTTDDDVEFPLIGEGNNSIGETTAQSSTPAVTTASTTTPTNSSLMAEGNHDGTILYVQYGAQTGTNYFQLSGGGQVKNCTSLPIAKLAEEAKKRPEFKIQKNAEPQVLIMHTHTTESFEPYERTYYDNAFGSRTTDMSRNMAAVGDVLTKQLEAAGIGVIHNTTIHDYPSYNGAYDRSEVTVKAILKEHPSIKVVLDLHRDAIERQGGVRVAPFIELQGKKAAQVMIIAGCDDGTMNMPNYMQNFRFAALLQQQIESDNHGITRPILFDYRHYNQDLTTGSLLIEIGGHANSLDQVTYSAELIGKSIATALQGLQ